MIEFQNVSKSFWTGKTRKVILNQASFLIEKGEGLGILAENGTGKTTLINMMAGTEKPDEGRIIRSSKISFTLGAPGGINAKHSARENCRYIARLYSLDPDYIEAYCRYVCDLDEYFEMPVSTYSKGMRARLSLALFLALDFEFFLIDEGMPNSTDAAFNARAGEILEDKLKNATVVIVSHSEKVLRKFATRAAVLEDGNLTFFDSLDDAKGKYDFSNKGMEYMFEAEE